MHYKHYIEMRECEHTRVLAAFVEGALQGHFGERPDEYAGDIKRPNAGSTYAAPDPHLKGQYHTCSNILTTYVHVCRGRISIQ
jgi:hypothetical protein